MATTISGPFESQGPTINGEETVLTLYTPEQFLAFPYVDQLCELINRSFRATNG
jgi:hypothetical protein